MKNYNKS